jgi:hypothetical protein
MQLPSNLGSLRFLVLSCLFGTLESWLSLPEQRKDAVAPRAPFNFSPNWTFLDSKTLQIRPSRIRLMHTLVLVRA